MLSTIKESLFNGLKKSLKGDLFCPNISGTFAAIGTQNTGPFSDINTLLHGALGDMIGVVVKSFNAHNSNAIYTDNGSVLPLSISKQSFIIYK